jgi:hypothetical protein
VETTRKQAKEVMMDVEKMMDAWVQQSLLTIPTLTARDKAIARDFFEYALSRMRCKRCEVDRIPLGARYRGCTYRNALMHDDKFDGDWEDFGCIHFEEWE